MLSKFARVAPKDNAIPLNNVFRHSTQVNILSHMNSIDQRIEGRFQVLDDARTQLCATFVRAIHGQ